MGIRLCLWFGSFGFFLNFVNIFVLLKDFSHNISLLTCMTNRIKTVRYYFRCYFPKHITVITNKNKYARKKIENVKNKLSVPTRLLLSNITFSPLTSNLGTLTPPLLQLPLTSLRSQLALSAFEVHNSHAFYVICLKYKQIVRSPHTYTYTHTHMQQWRGACPHINNKHACRLLCQIWAPFCYIFRTSLLVVLFIATCHTASLTHKRFCPQADFVTHSVTCIYPYA